MIVEAQVTITGSKVAIYAAMTDIEHALEIVSGIEKALIRKPKPG